jgi:hypothetical protein
VVWVGDRCEIEIGRKPLRAQRQRNQPFSRLSELCVLWR